MKQYRFESLADPKLDVERVELMVKNGIMKLSKFKVIFM